MSTKLFPVYSFIVDQGNVALGQFIGLNLGPNLVATQQGLFLGLDAAPSSGGSGAVIFDGGVPVKNARTDRGATQSPINNTKQGIINLGSRSIGVTAGATGNYATILGGDQNTASADGSTVCGGSLNVASGPNSTVGGGSGNVASGNRSVICGGEGNIASGIGAMILGEEAEAAGDHSTAIGHFAKVYLANTNGVAIGTSAEAIDTRDMAIGELCVAQGSNSFAAGYFTYSDGFKSLALGWEAWAQSTSGIAIGTGTTAEGQRGIAIGTNTNTDPSGDQIAIGTNVSGGASRAVAIGNGASTSDAGAVAIGDTTAAGGADSVCIGQNTGAYRLGAIRIGANSIFGANAIRAIVIGDSGLANFGATESTLLGYGNYVSATGVRALALGALHQLDAPSCAAIGENCRADVAAVRGMVSGIGANITQYGEAYRTTWDPAFSYYGGTHEVEVNGTGTAASVNLQLGDGTELQLQTLGQPNIAIRVTVEILAADSTQITGRQTWEVTARIVGFTPLVIQDAQNTFTDVGGATFTTTISVTGATRLRINCNPGAATQKYLARVTWSLIPF